MTPPTSDTADDGSAKRELYYAEGAAWAGETLGRLRASRAAAWRLAALALIVMLLNGFALVGLQPLRRNVAYAFDVRAQQGPSLVVRPLLSGALQTDPAFTQSMMARYVTAREEFSATRIRADYRTVELLSTPNVGAEYANSLRLTSGVSPLTRFPPKAVIDVEIASVSILDATHALVRYALAPAGAPLSQPEPAQAEITFSYSHAPMREIDRYDNPLGFQVAAYRSAPG